MRIGCKGTRSACFAVVALASTLAFRAVAQTATPVATPTPAPKGKGKPVPIIVTLNYDANDVPTAIATPIPDATLSKKLHHFANWCLFSSSDNATMTIDFKTDSPFTSKQYKTNSCVRSEQARPDANEASYKYSITVTVDGKALPVLDPIIKVTP